jgi:predicted lipoprotein with Yx(FWY)xxD motif
MTPVLDWQSSAAADPVVRDMTKSHALPKLAALLSVGALGLAACGGGGGGNADAATTSAKHLVSAKTISGMTVLVNSRGHAIYSPTQEKKGKIKTNRAALAVWPLVKAGSAKARKSSGVAHLGVVKRPDGKKQLTYKGRPLYTFKPEGAGKITGDGLKDSFGGKKFTWHVVKTKKSSSSQPAPMNNNGYGGY